MLFEPLTPLVSFLPSFTITRIDILFIITCQNPNNAPRTLSFQHQPFVTRGSKAFFQHLKVQSVVP
ncbi:hypothetical protein HanIR_Chr03g0145141 [Helianthus annuus]|nr:hypothetical protein HanIR_Chr03g0145141 [Helianthus annuus]